MKDWVYGNDKWHSVALTQDIDEESPYGVPKDLFFSYPVTSADGKNYVIDGISVEDEETQSSFKTTIDELIFERGCIEHLLI